MNLLKLIFTILLISNITYGQTKSPYLINNELFELPGKWEYIGKIESSAQWGFTNKKLKITLLINVRKIENFEFYNKDLSEFEFLNAFYIWETEFWGKADQNIEIENIEFNEQKKYIIWRLKIKDKNVENFILSSVRNDNLIGISFSDNNKKKPKNRNEIIDYLKKVYFNQ